MPTFCFCVLAVFEELVYLVYFPPCTLVLRLSDWKEGCVLRIGFCIDFYPVQNLHFVTSSDSWFIYYRQSKKCLFETSCRNEFIFAVSKVHLFRTLFREMNNSVLKGNVSVNSVLLEIVCSVWGVSRKTVHVNFSEQY